MHLKKAFAIYDYRHDYGDKMTSLKYVSKADLKAHMLEYFRDIERSGDEIIVTDHKKPVLKIVPIERKYNSAAKVFGPYRSRLKIYEDLTTPTADEWEELK